jgi:hypothetical protein
MSVHVGARVKQLVENNYRGTKKQFAADIGLKNHTYLHKLFLKDNLSTAMLKRIATILNVEVIDIIKDNFSQVNEERAPYMTAFSEKKELEISRKRIEDLERIVKMQDVELTNKEHQIESFKKQIDKLTKLLAKKK